MQIKSSGASSSANDIASAKIRRPSASVLLISTVRPFLDLSISWGLKALYEIEFSTAGIKTRNLMSS